MCGSAASARTGRRRSGLKSLVAAYRSLAGSFTPAAREHALQLEEALADVVLFGTLHQVELAARCATELKLGAPVDYQPLIDSLRADLRAQLGLEQIPENLVLPASGPGRALRAGRGDVEGGGRGEARGGGGGGGAPAGAGGLGAGLAVSGAAGRTDQP